MEPDRVSFEAIRKISAAYERGRQQRHHAEFSCRSHRVGSTTYTKCDDGKPSTPPTSCRTHTVGSTVYAKCETR
jgi:hypothetical protein